MRTLDLFDCIGLRLVSFGTILLFTGLVGQSQTAPQKEKADQQALDISFSVRGVIGKIYIVASTKHQKQAVGVEESYDEGLLFKFAENNDTYKRVFTSEPVEGTEEGVEFPGKNTMEYNFFGILPYRVEVFRKEDHSYDDGDTLVGTVFTDIADIAHKKQIVKRLSIEEWDNKWIDGDGTLIISSNENLKGCKEQVAFEIQGEMFHQEDSMYPYVILSKQISHEPEEWMIIDKTSMVGFGNTAEPKFRPLSVRKSHVTDEKDVELQIKFTCVLRNLDDVDKKDIVLGEFQTSFYEITGGETFACAEEGQNKNLLTIGTLKTVPTFLEIIQSDMKIEAHVAIDFTLSNSQQSNEKPYGLHTVKSQGSLNYYEQAIISIIPVIEHYDTDKQIPLTGFGGRFPPQGVDHFFFLGPLMERGNNCAGTMELLQVYRYVMLHDKIKLSSPTYYAPTIKHIVDQACEHKGKNDAFFLLVMLVDGKYTDPLATKAQIAIGSECPISILLVGIGSKYDEFLQLVELDADNGIPLKGVDQNGVLHIAVADIVQHVPYNSLIDSHKTLPEAMDALTREILAEFPTHVRNYFKLHNLQVKSLPHGIESIQNVEVPTAKAAKNFSELLNNFGYQDHGITLF